MPAAPQVTSNKVRHNRHCICHRSHFLCIWRPSLKPSINLPLKARQASRCCPDFHMQGCDLDRFRNFIAFSCAAEIQQFHQFMKGISPSCLHRQPKTQTCQTRVVHLGSHFPRVLAEGKAGLEHHAEIVTSVPRMELHSPTQLCDPGLLVSPACMGADIHPHYFLQAHFPGHAPRSRAGASVVWR